MITANVRVIGGKYCIPGEGGLHVLQLYAYNCFMMISSR